MAYSNGSISAFLFLHKDTYKWLGNSTRSSRFGELDAIEPNRDNNVRQRDVPGDDLVLTLQHILHKWLPLVLARRLRVSRVWR